jgi:hypothetical protein
MQLPVTFQMPVVAAVPLPAVLLLASQLALYPDPVAFAAHAAAHVRPTVALLQLRSQLLL